MANYKQIVRLRPEVRDFIRNRRWVHRGDVVAYGPNIRCPSFSTDSGGFRHSRWKGADLSVGDCIRSSRYGLMLGPSSVYGFGLAGNENSAPSLLGERFGFPFANLGLPEGNSRNLHSILYSLLVRAPNPPAVVLHISGGDFTNFCYTAIADPIYGSPNLKQMAMVAEERRGVTSTGSQIKPLLAFTSLWIRAIAETCRSRKIPLVLGDDTTFFEKQAPNEVETQSELGVPVGDAQRRQFAIHRNHVVAYHARRQAVADCLNVPLVGPGKVNDLGFVDEFHYDRDGTRSLTDDYARGIEKLI